MEFRNILQSRKIVWALAAIAGLIVILVIFQLGIVVGENKATDSILWGEFNPRLGGSQNVEAGGRGTFMGLSYLPGGMEGGDISDTQGALGQIIKINSATNFTIEEANDTQKTVLLGTTTAIRQFKSTITAADLSVGDNVMILGAPNDSGQIEAALVRVVPTGPGNAAPNQPIPQQN